ncbi:hypothetical protein M2189_004458 [Bradyrhizobium japonicum]|uniref:DUF1883 domain-containing protein n=1 Tax=Bradyrhizobium japonicum TaxID=375 RepID=UPI0021671F80|nr:DUF1883 domain-containing protein [Bradyrhizobium japonicum]MCS3496583.1 hypothetical protein [Bradyrhizobium japonicum]MCS3961255.1 hypothetical protein [Bradyrhizobium japonicum]MCS4003009.1 hypothetical protein [Bradyrhizobium japonicum]
MGFLHTDLGYLSGGEVVVVDLDHAANVRLMDSSNFSSYQRGGNARFYGGEARQTPVRLKVPQAGHWHVTIDLGGRGGMIRAGVRVVS